MVLSTYCFIINQYQFNLFIYHISVSQQNIGENNNMLELPMFIPKIFKCHRTNNQSSITSDSEESAIDHARKFRFSEDTRKAYTRYQEYGRFSNKQILDHPKMLSHNHHNSQHVGHYNVQPIFTIHGNQKLKRRISTAGNSKRFPKDFFKLNQQCSSTKSSNNNCNKSVFKIKRNLFEEFMKKKFQNRKVSLLEKQQIMIPKNQNQLTPKFKQPSPKTNQNSPKAEQNNEFLILDCSISIKNHYPLQQENQNNLNQKVHRITPFLSDDLNKMSKKITTKPNINILKRLKGECWKKNKQSKPNISAEQSAKNIQNIDMIKSRSFGQNKENLELPIIGITTTGKNAIK